MLLDSQHDPLRTFLYEYKMDRGVTYEVISACQ